jgi:hypothetical protein
MMTMNQDATKAKAPDYPGFQLPEKRFLSRAEAAGYLGVCVDTFVTFMIPAIVVGPRIARWDVEDIIEFMHNQKDDSARTSVSHTQEDGRKCVSIRDKARRIGGSHGTTRTESVIAEVLEL